eukprot:2211047-Rhodomonas_salina.2
MGWCVLPPPPPPSTLRCSRFALLFPLAPSHNWQRREEVEAALAAKVLCFPLLCEAAVLLCRTLIACCLQQDDIHQHSTALACCLS